MSFGQVWAQGRRRVVVNQTSRVASVLVALVLLAWTGAAQAQFFLGAPNPTFNTTSGAITNTPAVIANNPNKEIDVNGQFDITNATPPLQTASFSVYCQLDPTYNGGT